MQKVTSAKLGDHFDGVIADLTASGRYPTTAETLRAGLRLLEEQEAEYLTKLETLRQALIEGEESGESDRSFKEIIAEAKQELKTERHGG
ncbi:type II toxin-antitoxin system ParD family antitoxin [Porticoccus sp. GXU_MW_L64]